MSLIGDYDKVISELRTERDRKYEAELRNWQIGQQNRGELIKLGIGMAVGAITGGLGYLPLAAGTTATKGAIIGGALGAIPGGLTLPFLGGKGSVGGTTKDATVNPVIDDTATENLTTDLTAGSMYPQLPKMEIIGKERSTDFLPTGAGTLPYTKPKRGLGFGMGYD